MADSDTHRDPPSEPAPRPRGGSSAPRPCPHSPRCPQAQAVDHDAARVVASHPEQGWSLLCNGVVLFDDTGELLPDRQAVAPHRPGCARWWPAAQQVRAA